MDVVDRGHQDPQPRPGRERPVDVVAERQALRSRIRLYEALAERARARSDRTSEVRAIMGRLDLDRRLFQLGHADGETIIRRDGEYLYEFAPGRHYPIDELVPGA